MLVCASDLDILRGQFLPIAHEFSDQLTVAISDEEEFEDELKSLGLDDWGEDIAVAIWASSREKYRLNEEYDKDSLHEFVKVREIWHSVVIRSCNRFTMLGLMELPTALLRVAEPHTVALNADADNYCRDEYNL